MLNAIAVATKVAAPHVGKALLSAGAGLGATAVAIKASGKAQAYTVNAVGHFQDAGRAVKTNVTVEKAEKVTTKTQERKAS